MPSHNEHAEKFFEVQAIMIYTRILAKNMESLSNNRTGLSRSKITRSPMRLRKSSSSSIWHSYSITPADDDHDDEYGIFILRTTVPSDMDVP